MEKAMNNKWEKWYDELPEHTKQYLNGQPLWHDKDLFKVALAMFVIGLLLGLAF
jgi:hypothetical protein